MSIVAKRLDGTEVDLGTGHFVLGGFPAVSERGTVAPPLFSALTYCVQTAGCIKMTLGMEVGLSPGDFVLDGDPALFPKKSGALPNLRPMSIVARLLNG